MAEILPLLVVVGGLALAMGFFTWLAALVRRRGLAGGAVRAALAAYEEAWHTTAHDSYQVSRAQTERKVPIPAPDDPWPGPHGAARITEARRGPLPGRRPRGLRGRLRRRPRRPR